MDTNNKVPIAILSILTFLAVLSIAYGSTQPSTNILLSRFSHEYMGEINIFTLIGIVLLPVSLLLLLVWIFTLPKNRNSKPAIQPRWWKPYWISLVLVTISIGALCPLLFRTPLTNSILYIGLAVAMEGVAYYGRVKQSLKLNRIMYILLGVPIGFVLWYIFWLLIVRNILPNVDENIALGILSLAVCYGIGALIGDLIGKLRHYRGPEKYQP
jgi:hypothetical protein